MNTGYYFENFGMDEDIVEKVRKELVYIKDRGSFIGANNNKIYFEVYKVKNEKGRIVISHGFTECIEKYMEIIYYFTREGYSVFIMEHRGHGRSGCLGKNNTQIHVEDFNYYVDDMKLFIDKEVLKNKNKNLFLFSHSMGGAIGIMFLEKYPEYFRKAILSSPMLQIAIGKVPGFLARTLAKYELLIGNEDKFILGNMPYDSTYNFFLASTSNESRYTYYYREILGNSKLQRGGGSYRWLYESLKAIKNILRRKNINKINAEVILFQSGRDDLVGERGIRKFIKRCNKAKLIKFNNAKHEIYLENNDILEKYLDIIFQFLEK
ncbi:MULTISPECIES: alpha/beta fold hydrolase [unclassified Clostridium]|jgi:lysophospholipase L2 PLDB|uniref:alpha/beta fold hydrolase n=1 Tax=unclassified Clostridium TaxID=2614128 RepID=UPI0025BE180D|nr:alpha/beta hydrolase [Clostridium sp.]MCI6691332.1 alpha/beta hydrolase [Clostridium sp.]MDY2631770.1 alpha/beta hydrolase [Clostridium sp.]MDY4253143.1 alpha/beta hydrolase [Clostridium sp.]MDY6227496.1 alpha/beta hydrolase [Clostridium sp.]